MNVLFIMSDDMCCNLDCYGVPSVKTPNIDRFAQKGVQFKRAYCQYPVCNASRSSLLTGLRPDTTKVLSNDAEDAFRLKLPNVVTMPQLFRENGYYTASIGKIIHCGVDASGKPASHQDPKSWDLCLAGGPHGDTQKGRTGLKGDYDSKIEVHGGKEDCWWLAADGVDADQPDGGIATEVIDLIEKNKDKPFFIAAGFLKPHVAFIAPKKYYDLYPPGSVTLPQEPADRSPLEPLALDFLDKFSKLSDEDRIALKRGYQSCQSFVDAQMGRVLDTLDRLKLWDNTIVVMMADHGFHLFNHNWIGKATLFESSCHVPMIVWAPGRPGMGKPAQGLVESLDIYPTMAELCGLNPPANLQGKSMASLLGNPSGPGKEAAYTEQTRKEGIGRTVRTDQWRYTEWPDGNKELYDHSKDGGEYYNLARDSQYEDICAKMKDLLHNPS